MDKNKLWAFDKMDIYYYLWPNKHIFYSKAQIIQGIISFSNNKIKKKWVKDLGVIQQSFSVIHDRS